MKTQKEINRLWALKTEMLSLYSKVRTKQDYKLVLEHINANLDSEDEQ